MNETVTTDLVREVFNNTIYSGLKTYVETNSIYEPLITKSKPSVSKVFPIIPVKLLPSTNEYGNLSYSEERFRFGIEINVNTQEKTVNGSKVAKRTICEELTSLIVKYFKENYRVTVLVTPNAPITDETVHRALIRVTGVIDTRYGLDNLVIYPR